MVWRAGPDLLPVGSPRQQLGAFWAALEAGRGVAVVDHLRPGLAGAAGRDIAAALASGSLDPAELVLFTSGSTTRPRAIRRSLRSWEISLAPFSALTGLTARDVVWLPGPLSSTMVLFGAFHAGRIGARVVLRGEDPAAPGAEVTAVHAVPAQLPAILGDIAAGRLPRLSALVVAGDRLPDRLRESARVLGLRLVEYYGAAELSFVAARSSHDPGDAQPPGLAPFPGVEVAVRSGVIWSRSPYLCEGYLARSHQAPALAAAAAVAAPGPLRRGSDGWASVGDLGELAQDAQGRPVLTVRGRGDAAVTVAGHTIPVEDIEAALAELPGIGDVTVLGLPHRRLGQLLVAVVVSDLTTAQLRRAARSLPAPARPRRWLHRDRIPRTPNGKVDRAAARAAVESLLPSSARGGQVSGAATAAGQVPARHLVGPDAR